MYEQHPLPSSDYSSVLIFLSHTSFPHFPNPSTRRLNQRSDSSTRRGSSLLWDGGASTGSNQGNHPHVQIGLPCYQSHPSEPASTGRRLLILNSRFNFLCLEMEPRKQKMDLQLQYLQLLELI